MGELGVAWTKGLQEGKGEEKRFVQVAVTLKHFDANSVEGGSSGDKGLNRHTVNVNLTNYLLADYYWPAFKAPIKRANAKGVMCSYNSVNGIPTCASPLMKAARAAWNFSGYVTSDSDAVGDEWNQHHYVKTGAEASCAAVKDGQCDIDSGNTFYNGLLKGVKEGHCSMADVDRARESILSPPPCPLAFD
jgi:beta-glucosidase-like glycosyl hydrolase